MAFIYLKRKREPIEVDNDRARKIKVLRFGNQSGEGKADPTELIDLGDDWAGELGQIVSVEIKKEQPKEIVVDPDIERREWTAKQLAQPIEVRAKGQLWRFQMSWWSRSKMKEKVPPQHTMDYAERLAIKYFKEHPNAPELDLDVFEPLLTKHWGVRKGTITSGIAQKMRLSPEGEKE